MTEIVFDLEPLDTGEKSPDAIPVLRTAFGKRNRIAMSVPRTSPFDPSRFPAAVAFDDQSGDDRLTVVHTTVSFIPDFGCAFVAADFSLEFSLREGGSPLVIDLVPREVVREEDYQSQRERTLNLKGSIAPGLAEIVAEAGHSASLEIGGKRRIRDIWAFGLGGTEAGWRFQSSVGHQLAGIYDDLQLIVRCPREGFLRAQVRFGAEIAVEDQLDHWATLAFGMDHARSGAGGLVEIGAA